MRWALAFRTPDATHLYRRRDRRAHGGGPAAWVSGSIRGETLATLIGLLAATGLRVSEALGLDPGDITADGLMIRETKFRKSRLVPLHPSARAALEGYIRRRASIKGQALFGNDHGLRPSYVTLYALFLRIGRETGIRGMPGEKGRGCTTCAIPSRCARSRPAAPTDAQSRGTCWRWPPISAMPIPATPGGICRRHPA